MIDTIEEQIYQYWRGKLLTMSPQLVNTDGTEYTTTIHRVFPAEVPPSNRLTGNMVAFIHNGNLYEETTSRMVVQASFTVRVYISNKVGADVQSAMREAIADVYHMLMSDRCSGTGNNQLGRNITIQSYETDIETPFDNYTAGDLNILIEYATRTNNPRLAV